MKLGVTYRSRPRLGETEGGDTAVVRSDGRRTLFGIVDALGPNRDAAQTARRVAGFLDRVALSETLPAIIEGLHRVLKGSRGAVATLCVHEEDRLQGIGVGNVELRATRATISPVFSSGILGLSLGPLRLFTAQLSRGARLTLFSDGVSRRFDPKRVEALPRAEACARIVAESGYEHDAATVLIAELEDA